MDNARKITDRKLAQMEKRIKKIYEESQKDIQRKWNEYMANAKKRLDKLESAYAEAQRAGDTAKIEQAKKRLEQAKKSATLQNKQYQDMVAETTRQIASANQTAIAYVNGQMPSVYTVNYNQAKVSAEDVGMNFKAVNEATVKRMITDGDIKLPPKKVSIPKDMRWNTKQINSSVLQGILQGESMDKIAKRLEPIIGNNGVSAIRTARTTVTGAENRGRFDSYKDLEEQGAVQEKVWIATPDGRTREWHLSMDEQSVPIDEDFVDGNGNKLSYPGDPNAAPESVYNCRCSMRTHIIGFRKTDGRIEYLEKTDKDTFHEKQIEDEKESRREEKKKK